MKHPLCECKSKHGTMPAYDKDRGWEGVRCKLCGKLIRIKRGEK